MVQQMGRHSCRNTLLWVFQSNMEEGEVTKFLNLSQFFDTEIIDVTNYFSKNYSTLRDLKFLLDPISIIRQRT
jgi:hypothetical protein